MRRAKVLLLDLKAYYPSPPYQMGLLVEYARLERAVRRRVDFVFHAATRDHPPRDVARAVLDARCDLLAVSSYAWTHERLAATLAALESADAPLPRIVVGGPNASGRFGAEILRRHRSVSALVEGEGEPAFRDVCAALAGDPAGDPFVQARNCVMRDDGGGGLVRRDVGHRIQLLDEVPSPYLSGLLPLRPSPIFYETNRGCPYRCAFCWWGNGNAKVYRMSLERIRAEMELFARGGVSAFWIADANFGIFPSDAEIAATMAEINLRHGRPFRHVGVNWAKQSSDRVLEIAKIFRDGGMGCTTTIALQSVTPQAERTTKRYALPPERFAALIRHAAREDLDTYTDMICGLPGETVDEFLDGLETVILTGVPAIMIHQLYLIPGTEFFDRQRELGLETLARDPDPHGDVVPGAVPRSDFARYVVVRHPHMTPVDQARGARLIGINHLLHNHDLGRPAILLLARHGLRPRDAYDFLDDVLLGRVRDVDGAGGTLLDELRACIGGFADTPGSDPYVFHARLSRVLWFTLDAHGRRHCRTEELETFLQAFFAALCTARRLRLDADQRQLLREMVTYAVLRAPKPAWRPAAHYTFAWDVDRLWQDMLTTVHEAAALPAAGGWSVTGARVRAALSELLRDDALARRRTSPTYRVINPWRIPPVLETADWLLGSRSKHCSIERA
ncbi:radical SAM protein [Candidatus Binatia bacterium]|jgi:radical SAM superfamily enzyme YgiQ (UPF0313 family)|nr:radical SAM protein [Candidatus Binatia bacterium]